MGHINLIERPRISIQYTYYGNELNGKKGDPLSIVYPHTKGGAALKVTDEK